MLCHHCGADIPGGWKRCQYCGSARPAPPVGDVTKAGLACPECGGALVSVPENRDYYETVMDYTDRAYEIREQHEATHSRALSAHRSKYAHYDRGLIVAGICLLLVFLTDNHYLAWALGITLVAGVIYSAYGWIEMATTAPRRPPLPPGANERAERQVLDHTHSGMMLKCLTCDWEDWAYNYNEAARQQVEEAKRQTQAAQRMAEAAEAQARAQQEQAAASWRLVEEARERDTE